MRGNTLRTTRIGAYVASAALVVSGTLLAAVPADAANNTGPMNAAANWLVNELDSGLMHYPASGGNPAYDDYGLSIDAGFALASTGGHTSTVQLISGAIADHINSYTTGADFGSPNDVYAGPVAKAAVMAALAGDDPTAYGGVNLITRLQARVSTSGRTTGRIADKFTPGPFGADYANSLGQAYAANALTRAGSTSATSVTSFLRKQQCSSGYFRLNFAARSAANQWCVNGKDAADPDATAVAVLQLSQLPASSANTTAINKAKAWLRNQQHCNGSFGGGPTTMAPNANSTGVVAWALGDTAASRQAAGWLRAHQATSADSGNDLATETGAIAYNNAALASGRSDGITASTLGQWRRATTQAAPGIKWYSTDPTPAISLTGPTAYLKARSHPVLTTTGAAAGTVLCLLGPSTSNRSIAGAGDWRSAVNLPAGTGTRTYTATDPFGHTDTVALRVLGAKNLPVGKSSYRVKRKHSVTATVYGLAPHEWSRLVYKGRLVARGPASDAGTLTATFKVGKAKGKKRIVGLGRFTDIRRGATTIKVVR